MIIICNSDGECISEGELNADPYDYYEVKRASRKSDDTIKSQQNQKQQEHFYNELKQKSIANDDVTQYDKKSCHLYC